MYYKRRWYDPVAPAVPTPHQNDEEKGAEESHIRAREEGS